MSATKQDYTAVASAIQRCRVSAERARALYGNAANRDEMSARIGAIDSVAYEISHAFARLNPRFDCAAFITACGVKAPMACTKENSND